MSNYCNEISDSLINNGCEWQTIGRGSVVNKKLGIKITRLGNGKYTGWFQCCFSILELYIHGVRVEVLDGNKKQIEKAYVEWLKTVSLSSVVRKD